MLSPGIIPTLAILLTSFTTLVWAQPAIKQFSIDEGLSHSVVTCLAEDPLGYLWIGTDGGGLSKFDGKDFQTLSIDQGFPNNTIYDIVISPEHTIWIANSESIVRFDGARTVIFPVDDANTPKQIVLHDDSLFFFTTRGEKSGFILDDSTHTLPKNHPFQGVTSIRKAGPSATLGIDRRARRFVFLHKGIYQLFQMPDGVNTIYDFVQSDTSYLIPTEKGLFKIVKNNLVNISKTKDIVRLTDTARSLLWVKRKNDLIAVSKPDDKAIAIIPNVLLRCSLRDREGNIWFGTAGKGIFKVQDLVFKPTGEIRPVEERDGVLSILVARNGDLWTGTATNGVIVYPKNDHTLAKARYPLQYCFTIREDSAGNVWMGTRTGLYISSGKEITKKYPDLTGILSFDFGVRGELVVSTTSRQLYYIEGPKMRELNLDRALVNSVSFQKNTKSFLLGTDSGLKKVMGGSVENLGPLNLNVSSTAVFPDGTVAAGTTESGVILRKGNKEKYISVKDGLLSNHIYITLVDENFLWVGTERGINRVTIDSVTGVQEVLSFGKQSGLDGISCNRNAAFSADSLIFFGLVSGIYKYNKFHKLKINANQAHYEQFLFQNGANDSITHQVVNFLEGKLPTTPIVINHTLNTLIFTVNKIDKAFPGEYFNTIVLRGPSRATSSRTNKRTFEFNNLGPGKYTLEVSVTDASGKRLYDQIHSSFYIKPAFYQTTLFFGSVGLLFALTIIFTLYYLHRRKVQKIFALQKNQMHQDSRLRNEIARDFHDELGNQVARMINSLDLLKLNKKLESDIYQNLSNSSQRILMGAKDFVWTLDPVNDELGNVIIHLKDFGESLFHEKQISFRFEGNVNFQKRLPQGYNRQINLIFKEAMTNAFKHSNASSVSFGVHVNAEAVILTITDNGVGIPSEIISNPERGINNMLYRSNKIKSRLEIVSDNNGTRIGLHVFL